MKLGFKSVHKGVHVSYVFSRRRIRAVLDSVLKGASLVKSKFNAAGGVVASVRPGGLLAWYKILYAAYHAVIAAVLQGISVSLQGWYVYFVVHERGISKASTYNLKAMV